MSALTQVTECADSAAALRAVVEDITAGLRQAIEARGHALLALSGGKSPIPMFEALSTQALDWSRVHITLVDERIVSPSHPASNAALVHTHLLRHRATAAHWWPWLQADDFESDGRACLTLDALCALAQMRLQAAPWPADVLVLGMGEDGHTASLFPGAPQLASALDTDSRLCWISPPAASGAAHERLSLSLRALLEARQLVLPLQGAAKRAVLEQAIALESDRYPISHVLHRAQRPVRVWLS